MCLSVYGPATGYLSAIPTTTGHNIIIFSLSVGSVKTLRLQRPLTALPGVRTTSLHEVKIELQGNFRYRHSRSISALYTVTTTTYVPLEELGQGAEELDHVDDKNQEREPCGYLRTLRVNFNISLPWKRTQPRPDRAHWELFFAPYHLYWIMSQPPLVVVELTTDVNSTVEHLHELGKATYHKNFAYSSTKSAYTLDYTCWYTWQGRSTNIIV